jgi:hypothetical protein
VAQSNSWTLATPERQFCQLSGRDHRNQVNAFSC